MDSALEMLNASEINLICPIGNVIHNDVYTGGQHKGCGGTRRQDLYPENKPLMCVSLRLSPATVMRILLQSEFEQKPP